MEYVKETECSSSNKQMIQPSVKNHEWTCVRFNLTVKCNQIYWRLRTHSWYEQDLSRKLILYTEGHTTGLCQDSGMKVSLTLNADMKPLVASINLTLHIQKCQVHKTNPLFFRGSSWCQISFTDYLYLTHTFSMGCFWKIRVYATPY